MRIYDPRLGRFLSVDPLTKQYPHYTPYSFAGNKPIAFIDRDGEEENLEWVMQYEQDLVLKGKITPQEMRDRQVARGMGALIGTAAVVTAFTGGRALPILQKVMTFALTNPQSTMTATGLLWGAVTDEDMPGGFDDVSRDVRQSITVGAKRFYNVEKAVKYEGYLSKYGQKVADAIWGAGGKGGANKLAEALEKAGVSLIDKQAHHIIPTELIERNTVVKEGIEQGFDFNGAINGIALGVDKHSGSHPQYTEFINNAITELRKNNPNSSAKQILETVAGQARKLIQGTEGKINKIPGQ